MTASVRMTGCSATDRKCATYQEAGIANPRQEIDLAMVHDCFTITELIIYEDLGFSPRGRASEDDKMTNHE